MNSVSNRVLAKTIYFKEFLKSTNRCAQIVSFINSVYYIQVLKIFHLSYNITCKCVLFKNDNISFMMNTVFQYS